MLSNSSSIELESWSRAKVEIKFWLESSKNCYPAQNPFPELSTTNLLLIFYHIFLKIARNEKIAFHKNRVFSLCKVHKGKNICWNCTNAIWLFLCGDSNIVIDNDFFEWYNLYMASAYNFVKKLTVVAVVCEI